LVSLNFLAFLLHTVFFFTERTAQQIRTGLGTLQTFRGELRMLARYFNFQSWAHLLDFMASHMELDASP
jgi:hypothetical protein